MARDLAAADRGRFASTIEFYLRYRPRYPDPFIAEVAAELGLDGRGRLLDLGCGPGFLAIAFRPYVAQAIGIDPEPLMLEAARASALAAGVDIELRSGDSTSLGDALAPLRLVTMGRSFHWMARARTLRRLDQLVEPGGAVVLFHDRAPKLPENAWHAVAREQGDRFAPDPDHPLQRRRRHDHASVLASSRFGSLHRIIFPQRRKIAIADAIGLALSKSSTSPARLGADRAAFEAAMAQALSPFATDGLLDQLLEFEALIARRPPA